MKAQELPQVNVQNPQGKSISSVSWIDHETPFVVSFWSTTCKPCLKELDALSEAENTITGKQVNFKQMDRNNVLQMHSLLSADEEGRQ